jgi:5'-3' exoribonuclease 2
VDLYLDRLVGLVRPTRLLLVAMDGVAPTAKMAQQRGRRFYAAHLERQREEVERQVRRGAPWAAVLSGRRPQQSWHTNACLPCLRARAETRAGRAVHRAGAA